jgi:hypothetical protein
MISSIRLDTLLLLSLDAWLVVVEVVLGGGAAVFVLLFAKSRAF